MKNKKGMEDFIMKVDVTLCVNDLKLDDLCNKTVIVIDSLRATSSILTALNNGCSKVIPVETVGQAMQFDCMENTILIGERYSKKIHGFDLGNSPTEINRLNLKNKTVVITSTNGTKALQKAKKAAHILVGSFLNATHCIETAIKLRKDIVFLCAGRRGKFAIEDGLTAGIMIQYLREHLPLVECSDIALLLSNTYADRKAELQQVVKEGATGKTLIETLQKEDLEYCLQIDQYQLTGVYQDDGIISYKDTQLMS